MSNIEQRFWHTLGHQQEWFTMPQKVYDDPIYMMRTQPGYIFDDAFWAVFHGFSFKICHVAYYGPERLEDVDVDTRMQDTGIFELRFALLRSRHWIVRFIDRLALFGKKTSPREEEYTCGIGPRIYRKTQEG